MKDTEATGIETSDAANARMYWMLMAALIAFAAYLYWDNRTSLAPDFAARQFNIGFAFLATLVLLGGVFGVKAAFATLRLRKYGMSWLHAGAVVPGGVFSALLRTSTDLAMPTTFHLKLRCIETSTSVGPDGESRHGRRIRWQTTVRIEADGLRSSDGIPFRIDVPARAAAARRPKNDPAQVGRQWSLLVRAPQPGLNFRALFALKRA